MDPRIAAACAVLLASVASVAHAAGIIYLEHDGVTVRPGDNNARTNTSSIPKRPTTIPAWSTTPDVWAATVACIADIYAPFDVVVTDVDPGDVPHIAAVFGGSPMTLDLPRVDAGVSPFADDCSAIESSMVFIFTEILGEDPAAACRVAAQEIAHSYGLDHELLAGDPMSYLPFSGNRAFVDQDAPCGEASARHCGRASTICSMTQNSFALLTERLGLAGTTATEPPAAGGCAAGRCPDSLGLALAVVAVLRRRLRERLRSSGSRGSRTGSSDPPTRS